MSSHASRSVLSIMLVSLLCAGCAAAGSAPTSNVPASAAPAAGTSAVSSNSSSTPTAAELAQARDKIKHIVMIMQENRSFNSYFGTYPGADGIPMQNGTPTVCLNDPQTNQCVQPYHDPSDTNAGGPHAATYATQDIDGGKMDGFVVSFREAAKACQNPNASRLRTGCHTGCDGLARRPRIAELLDLC